MRLENCWGVGNILYWVLKIIFNFGFYLSEMGSYLKVLSKGVKCLIIVLKELFKFLCGK